MASASLVRSGLSNLRNVSTRSPLGSLASYSRLGPNHLLGASSVVVVSSTNVVNLSRTQIRGKKTRSGSSDDNSKSSKKGSKSSSSDASEEVAEAPPFDFDALFRGVEDKMSHSVEHFSKEVAVLENRASGRVNAALLEPVRVSAGDGPKRKLNELATIGVKEGNVLVVTVFEESVSAHIGIRLSLGVRVTGL